MPTIDDREGLLVIRIVYDGPALSGKTTSLRALAAGGSSRLVSPEERDGRTLFFDWMDYVGGIFEGRKIRCQTISVPGQGQLWLRRRILLETADAVVCVLDTRRAELDFGIEWLRNLVPHCRAESPPVGIVLQANKRDARDAVPRAELYNRVNEVAPVAVVETVATAADGIRQAFVFAVRLALDRVRALSAEGRLTTGAPREDDSHALLQTLLAAETDIKVRTTPPKRSPRPPPDLRSPLPAAPSEPPLAVEGMGDSHEELVFVPDPHMPGGMIWPPVDGRALLHEVASLDIRPSRTERGDWAATGSGWRFHSGLRGLYSDQDDARHHLIAWAQFHAASAEQISSGRALILADAGRGRFRLWQLLRVEAVLKEHLAQVAVAVDPVAVAHGLVEVGACVLRARAWFDRAKAHLPCTLWTIGVGRAYRPHYVGLMPDATIEKEAEPQGLALLERELAPPMRELRRARVDYADVNREIIALGEAGARESPSRLLAEVVRAID